MRRRVKAVFSTYIVITIPVLAVLLALMVSNLPKLVITAWDALLYQQVTWGNISFPQPTNYPENPPQTGAGVLSETPSARMSELSRRRQGPRARRRKSAP